MTTPGRLLAFRLARPTPAVSSPAPVEPAHVLIPGEHQRTSARPRGSAVSMTTNRPVSCMQTARRAAHQLLSSGIFVNYLGTILDLHRTPMK